MKVWARSFCAAVSADPVKALALFVLFMDMTFAMASGIISYDVVRGGSPITADLYGPEVHAIPALVWTSIQEKAALSGMLGAVLIASHSRWAWFGGWMALVGNVVLVALFATLASKAFGAPQGIVMFAMCAACGVFWSLACAVLAWLFLAGGCAK